MTESSLSGECFRCGYDLRGVADEQACPECGLLAVRSRRATDELHDTRPQWLRRLAWGVNLLLLAILSILAWPFVASMLVRQFEKILTVWASAAAWWSHLSFLGLDAAAALAVCGVFLLTSREGYPPADQADATRRRCLRVLALVPWIACAVIHTMLEFERRTSSWPPFDAAIRWITSGLLTVATALLIVLLFLQLRSLAKRARSAHLIEHCAIVGIGAAAAVLYMFLVSIVMVHGDEWFGWGWRNRSRALLALNLTAGVASLLFMLWALYVLLRFAVAFARARRQLKGKWAKADRAIDTVEYARDTPFG